MHAGHQPAKQHLCPISPASIWCAIHDGQYYVLEDNLRTPSGVSYMLENRKMMMRLYPEMFEQHHIAPVERYPSYLLQTLRESSLVDDPCVVVMIPGRFNSAYFEHSFLAQQMGGRGWWRAPTCSLRTARCICGPPRAAASGCDLSPASTTPGSTRPLLAADSMLGVPGLLSVYRAGGVVLANAIGTGVADDKSIYPYVPGNDPLLPRRTADPQQYPHLAVPESRGPALCAGNLELMVVKEVHGAGATACWLARVRLKRSERPSASACWLIRPTISPRTPSRCRPAHLR